ncbi:MAG: LCP family protein [Thermoleophilaceae bacterium]
MTGSFRNRHPALAATLSFVFPGLGQAYAGQRELAVVLAVPILLVVAAGILVAVLFEDQLRNQLFSSTFLAGLLVLDVALLGWRLFAIAHAGLAGTSLRSTRVQAMASVVLLSVLSVGMHAYVGYVIGRLDAALTEVFSGANDGRPAEGSPARGADPDEPLNAPDFRWDGTEPVNLLLLGVDAAPGRDHALTDTILVVSVDPTTQEAVMVSVPRDTGSMPLRHTRIYSDGLYPHKINQLASEASASPELWCPDREDAAEGCGIRTLQRTVGLYLGIPIHHYALVDLSGFAHLVDTIGGVELCLPGRLSDPEYLDPETGERGITLHTGCHSYDGDEALAFVRIRSGVLVLPDGTVEPQDDFKRAERQQQLLLAVQREIASADTFLALPALVDAIADTVSTDFPRDKGGDLASLLPLITGPDIERVVLGLPDFVEPPVDPETNYLLIPRRDAIRDEAERLFGDDGELEGWYVGSHAPGPGRDADEAGDEGDEPDA